MEKNYFTDFFNFIILIIQSVIGLIIGFAMMIFDLGCLAIYLLAIISVLVWFYHLFF